MGSVKIYAIVFGLLAVFGFTLISIDLFNKKKLNDLQSMQNSQGFAVVELFTSEGCSSCPPADHLVEEIQRNNKNSQIYILSYHVDYWDHQGWKDKYSSSEFSERHKQYGKWLKLGILYTPQFVINGSDEFVGSNQSAILRTIGKGLGEIPLERLKLKAKIETNTLHVEYSGNWANNSELVLAVVQKSAKSQVTAGENSGVSLSHVQIVRQLLHIDAGSSKDINIVLPDDFKENIWELIGFMQRKNDGKITAVDKVELR